MGADFNMELDPNVGVSVVTFLAFEDDRPAELVLAGTADDEVKHMKLSEQGMRLFAGFMGLLMTDDLVIPVE